MKDFTKQRDNFKKLRDVEKGLGERVGNSERIRSKVIILNNQYNYGINLNEMRLTINGHTFLATFVYR